MESANSDSSNTKNDPGWKYCRYANILDKSKGIVCNFCEKITNGGIFRAKQHLVGGFRCSKKCTKCPSHVVEELKNYMEKKKVLRITKISSEFETIEEEEEEEEGMNNGVTKQVKKQKVKGPMDLLLASKGSKDSKLKQATMNQFCKKELREKTCEAIAECMYDAGIPFNAVNYPSFKNMVERIGQFGIGMKPPSYHEVRVPLLKKAVNQVNEMLNSYREEWAKNGCSIMADGWTERKNRTLINFLVNSPKGSIFVESIDASDYAKTGEKMFELFDKMVERIGESNVVQFVTDSASSNVLAGRLLMAKMQHLFWTPCAAHCIDLMLEDIGKIERVKLTLKRATQFSSYIYVRPGVVNLMRKFTGDRELFRPAVTRFATAYLTLASIHKQKVNLRKMFTSEEWNNSKWSKEAAGKRASHTVLMSSFWVNIVYILKVLVRVLRLVDGEKKPPMGYIYEAMDRARETIAKSFNDNKRKYEDVEKIIDHRWEIQLHQPLHAVAHYFNPEFFYKRSDEICGCKEIVDGFYDTLCRLVPSTSEQDLISHQISEYEKAKGLFGKPIAVRNITTISPAEWWHKYGASTPELRKFAIKVLSLTCSASGCERNWSIFENIHSKKRNRLAQNRLNDLVFVKYNRALKRRYDMRDSIDPISLTHIDESNEWLMGGAQDSDEENDELVFDGDDLTWGAVAKASGVDERDHSTRSSKGKNINPNPTSNLAKEKRKEYIYSRFKRHTPSPSIHPTNDDEIENDEDEEGLEKEEFMNIDEENEEEEEEYGDFDEGFVDEED